MIATTLVVEGHHYHLYSGTQQLTGNNGKVTLGTQWGVGAGGAAG